MKSVIGVEGAARFGFLYQRAVAEIASVRTTRADVALSSSCQWLKSVFIAATPEQFPLL